MNKNNGPDRHQVTTFLNTATLKRAQSLAKERDWSLAKAVAKLAEWGSKRQGVDLEPLRVGGDRRKGKG